MTSSWNTKIRGQGYNVTPEERATNSNYLNSSIDLISTLNTFIQNNSMSGIFNYSEKIQLEKAVKLIKDAQVPMALLREKKVKQLKLR